MLIESLKSIFGPVFEIEATGNVRVIGVGLMAAAGESAGAFHASTFSNASIVAVLAFVGE